MFRKFIIALSTVFIAAATVAAPARAETPAWMDDIEVSTALVCDTQQQVERFLALLQSGAESALAAVNAEEKDPTACAEVNLAYVRGARLATVRTRDEAYAIVEILAIGVATENGVRAIAPVIYISLFEIDERAT
jgi:hypothetical protein